MLEEIILDSPNSNLKTKTDLESILSPRYRDTTSSSFSSSTAPPVPNNKNQQHSQETYHNIDSLQNVNIDPQTQYIIHTVDRKDTLQGLALRYCVTVQQIKTENKIWNFSGIQKQLIIPVRFDELQERLHSRNKEKTHFEKEKLETIKSFMEITNTSEQDLALKYLKSTQFNLERAIDKYHIDRNIQIPKNRKRYTADYRSMSASSNAVSSKYDRSGVTESSPILMSNQYYSYNNSFTNNPSRGISPDKTKEGSALFDFI